MVAFCVLVQNVDGFVHSEVIDGIISQLTGHFITLLFEKADYASSGST